MTRAPRDPRISSTIAYMQCALGHRIAIADLAARVHLPPGRFRRLFTSQVGMDPAYYLRRMRLRRARLLIDRTFLSVPEVMALVGYTSVRTFSRDFHAMFGVAPAAQRGTSAATPLPRDAIAWTTHDGSGRSHDGPAHRHDGPAHRHDGPAHRHDGPAHRHDRPAPVRPDADAMPRDRVKHAPQGSPAKTRDPALLFA
jgi:AraC-like DNA-binding protein